MHSISVDEDEVRGSRPWMPSLNRIIGYSFGVVCALLTLLAFISKTDINGSTGEKATIYTESKDKIDTTQDGAVPSDVASPNMMQCRPEDNCCVLGETCPVCNAPTIAPKDQRIRRNIMSLSSEELDALYAAFRVIKNTPTLDGQELYGPYFKEYNYFVAKHYAAVRDPRGDQGHSSSAFMTYHSLLVLEFEMVLLAVNPSIGALPYWNWNDTVNSVNYPFNSDMFGSAPGTGEFYQVIDGAFANWPIEKINHESYLESYSKYFTFPEYIGSMMGNTSSGFIRMSAYSNPNMTRFGTPIALSVYGYVAQCASVDRFPFFYWYACLDMAFPAYHGTPHNVVGGKYSTEAGAIYLGDFYDADTSPNDPIFMFHHPNMDRNKMMWMSLHPETADIFYGYPLTSYPRLGNSPDDGYSHGGGLGLLESVAAGWGFKDTDVGIPAHAARPDAASLLWTHADALCYLQPHTAPYRYDVLG